jgi:hypothetical protein
MDPDELHEAFPWTTELLFNEAMTKADLGKEHLVPDKHCLFGTKQDGTTHRFIIANRQGEILPRFLNSKWILFESGKAFGNVTTTKVNKGEKTKCKCKVNINESCACFTAVAPNNNSRCFLLIVYAMVREAQVRGIEEYQSVE